MGYGSERKMQKIQIKAEHEVLLNKPLGENASLIFKIPLENSEQAKVTLVLKENRLLVEVEEHLITNDLFNFLKQTDARVIGDPMKFSEDFSGKFKDEIELINSICTRASQKVLSLLKYFLGYYDISESLFSIKLISWKGQNQPWRLVPHFFEISGDVKYTQPLDDSARSALQNFIDEEIEPLLALRYLHKAKNEKIPHYKWINATIAAELAIKEVLIRAKPDLAVVLLEVPMPPLDKLYGPILKVYLKEQSPVLRDIKNGVEKRNKLLHKPQNTPIDAQEAIEYVNNIELAIFHLLSLLYPQNTLIKQKLELINIVTSKNVINEK